MEGEQSKTIKTAKVVTDQKKAQAQHELNQDINSYFTEQGKTITGGDGKINDMQEMSEAEKEVKELLYQNSLKSVSLPSHIQPMFNTLFLTARRNKMTTDSGLVLTSAMLGDADGIDFAKEQEVLAAGPQVQQALPGAKVIIDFESLRVRLSESMAQKVNKESEIKVPTVWINDVEYIKVSERNLEYISDISGIKALPTKLAGSSK